LLAQPRVADLLPLEEQAGLPRRPLGHAPQGLDDRSRRLGHQCLPPGFGRLNYKEYDPTGWLDSCEWANEMEATTMSQATSSAPTGLHDLEWYRSMRDTDPVRQDPKTGIWNVYRYQDVANVLADYRTFSSDFSAVFPDQASLTEGNIVAMDPPRHHQLR